MFTNNYENSMKVSVFDILSMMLPSPLYNKRPMGPVSLTRFRLQNYLKVFTIPETLF